MNFKTLIVSMFFLSNLALAGPLPTPSLSSAETTKTTIDIVFTAGGSLGGAPAGFSLQWMDYSNFTGWPISTDGAEGLCKSSFSGVPGYNQGGGTRYSLDPYQSVTIRVGDILLDQGASTNCDENLKCNTTYIFRAFSHNVPKSTFKKSEFSQDYIVKTKPCFTAIQCTYSQGYWKNHSVLGPASPKNYVDGIWDGTYLSQYPVAGITLGNKYYSELELVTILNTVGTRGNGLPALAHQLIAVKLSGANGMDLSLIQNSVNSADALIGNLVPGIDTLPSSVTSPLTTALDNFIQNNHCQ